MEELEIEILPLTQNEFIFSSIGPIFKKKNIYIVIALVIVSNLLVIYGNNHMHSIALYLLIVVYDIVMICLFWFKLLRGYKKYVMAAKHGAKSFISITQERIKISSTIGKTVEASWGVVTDIKNKPNILAIYTTTTKRAIGIPKRSFHSELEAEEFIGKMQEYWKKDKIL
ncbi:hypothetical protein PU629_02250 [Pullulanibacillus sp. KACC 23026]|uniref:hypothetical protein n=1 Tax=Pullulanibacillus sp. KACC 23026 TaxID=3028315 RepID=UPI0023B1A60D|nr:hypothetical protein [Pullulanibacillus sp. KACC 23026]WEG13207.1 hypothetical protein PU629_02250 [Pullulanibacillus sp. KACC 23026]